MTWWRGSAPRDLAPAMNCRDIHPSMRQQNQSTQSRHIDMKARNGWTEVRCSTTPSGIERTNVAKHSCLTKDSKYSLHERRTHTQGGCILTKRRLLHRRITWVFIQWRRVCEKLTLNLGANHHTKGPLYFWLTEVETQAISSILAQVLGCMCTFH